MLTSRTTPQTKKLTRADIGYRNRKCSCGAVHVIFTSKKAYPGQDRDELKFACLRCGKSGLDLDVYDSGWYEVYLKEELPGDRVGWLPASSKWDVSQRDYPAQQLWPEVSLKTKLLVVWTVLFVGALLFFLAR